MQPVVEDVDEEEGGPTVSPAPAVRPSLHGLDREFSTRFGTTTNSSGNNGSGDASSGTGQQQQHAPNFSDYLRAQRTLNYSRRRLSSSTAVLLQSLDRPVDDGDTAAAATSPAAANNNNDDGDNNDPAAQPSLQANLAVANAITKFRRRSNAATAPSNSSFRTPQEQKTLRALNAHGKRGSAANLMMDYEDDDDDAQVSWEKRFSEMEAMDEDGHFAEDGHDHSMLWYSPPIQRQRWDQDQILPHVNWGDLFFDLFYVAAAYNLGVMLTSAMNDQNWLRGIIYYIGTFGPLWTSWETSMFFESRYTTVDYSHRLFEVVRYLFVSTAVVHVKSVESLADPKSAESLVFTCAILCESIMHLALNLELYFMGQGERSTIKNHTMAKMKYQMLPVMLVYSAAVISAAVLFVRPDGDDDYDDAKHDRLLAAAADGDYDEYGGNENYYAESPIWELSDLPLTLTAFGYLQNIVFSTIRKFRATNGKYGDIRKRFVPNNVDYVIHRYGEWILLMIGEGVLSLLIVDTANTKDYYIITTFGVLTVIFIQILKFESEPSHAEGHALWKNLLHSMCYSYLIQVLSMGLIVFGVTYKVFLIDVVKDAEKKEKEAGYGYDDGSKASRMLGASPVISDEDSAALFSAGLFVVIISLELMCLTHCGIKRALEHMVRRQKGGQHGKTMVPHWPVIIIALFKVGIILFTMTLSQWTKDPAELTTCGFCIVLALSASRVMNFFFIHRKEVIQNLTETVRTTVGRAAAVLPPVISETGEKAAQRASDSWTMARNTVTGASSRDPKYDASAPTSNLSNDSARLEKKSEDRTSSTKSDTILTDNDLTSGINSSFDGIVVADLNGIITQVNDTVVTLFGYATKIEMIGKNLSILVGGSDGKRHDGYVKAFKKRVTTNANPQHKVLGRQRMLHACRADGTEFPCIIGIKMVSNNTRIAGYIRDMSGVVSEEKKKASMEMNTNEAIERVVDDHAFDAIIASNDHGIIQRVNDRCVAEFGYESKGELVSKNISVLMHDVIGHPELLSDSHGEQRLAVLTRKDGKEFQCIVASKKIKGTDNMVAFYVRNLDRAKASFKCEKCD